MPETTENQPIWYTMTPEEVGDKINVDPAKGLSTSEAQQRLSKYGPTQEPQRERIKNFRQSGIVSAIEKLKQVIS